MDKTKETKNVKKPLIRKTVRSETLEKTAKNANAKDTSRAKITLDKEVSSTKHGNMNNLNQGNEKNGKDKEISMEAVAVEKVAEGKVKITKKENTPKKVKNTTNGFYATGRRKNATARVWLKEGNGGIKINGKEALAYLKRPILEVIINTPFDVTDTKNKYVAICTVSGGGLSGQAGAVKHGIARALVSMNAEAYRSDLKLAGLLTRDSRIVERKKPGLKKARKGQVFSKR